MFNCFIIHITLNHSVRVLEKTFYAVGYNREENEGAAVINMITMSSRRRQQMMQAVNKPLDYKVHSQDHQEQLR